MSTKKTRQERIKQAIVRIMAHCGPYDSWKKNEHPQLSMAIIELSNLLGEPFTTVEAVNLARHIGVNLTDTAKA